MDIKISIVLKDKTYGFSDLLDGRELNNQTKEEIIDLIKEDIGYVFDQQIEVEQLFIPDVIKVNQKQKSMGVSINIVITRSKDGSLDIWYKGNLLMSGASEEDLNEVIEMLYTR